MTKRLLKLHHFSHFHRAFGGKKLPLPLASHFHTKKKNWCEILWQCFFFCHTHATFQVYLFSAVFIFVSPKNIRSPLTVSVGKYLKEKFTCWVGESFPIFIINIFLFLNLFWRGLVLAKLNIFFLVSVLFHHKKSIQRENMVLLSVHSVLILSPWNRWCHTNFILWGAHVLGKTFAQSTRSRGVTEKT